MTLPTPEAYAAIAASTAIYPKVEEYCGAYAILGLIDECGELIEHMWDLSRVNVVAIEKEAGDVLWYVAETCLQHCISFPQVCGDSWTCTGNAMLNDWPRFRDEISTYCFKLAGMQKKSVRDNALDGAELANYLASILARVAGVLNTFDVTLQQAAGKNNEKLLDRQRRGVLQGSGDNR